MDRTEAIFEIEATMQIAWEKGLLHAYKFLMVELQKLKDEDSKEPSIGYSFSPSFYEDMKKKL
jgi:hypothetical protein